MHEEDYVWPDNADDLEADYRLKVALASLPEGTVLRSTTGWELPHVWVEIPS
jgi:hypothetical protein